MLEMQAHPSTQSRAIAVPCALLAQAHPSYESRRRTGDYLRRSAPTSQPMANAVKSKE